MQLEAFIADRGEAAQIQFFELLSFDSPPGGDKLKSPDMIFSMVEEVGVGRHS